MPRYQIIVTYQDVVETDAPDEYTARLIVNEDAAEIIAVTGVDQIVTKIAKPLGFRDVTPVEEDEV